MKRFFALSMVFCLLMALCLPCLASSVSAADVYVFERLPDVSFYTDDFVFIPEEFSVRIGLACEGRVPVGTYMIYPESSAYSVSVLDPFVVSYDNIVLEIPECSALQVLNCRIAFSDGTFSDDSFLFFVSYSEELNVTFLVFGFFDGDSFIDCSENVDFIRFVPLASSGASSLTSFMSSDVLDGALLQVVYLIPVVLGVLVSVCGLRKAVSFLVKILHNS